MNLKLRTFLSWLIFIRLWRDNLNEKIASSVDDKTRLKLRHAKSSIHSSAINTRKEKSWWFHEKVSEVKKKKQKILK